MGYALCFMAGAIMALATQNQVFNVSEFLLVLFVAVVTLVVISED